MAANGKPGVFLLCAIALVAWVAWWVAHAQVGAAGAAPTPTTGPAHEFQQAGARKDQIDCMAFLGRCNERVQACETERAHCQSEVASQHQELQDAYAEIADLRPRAALPVCSGRKDWIHASLPTVHCDP
jgi:hypothetical protein